MITNTMWNLGLNHGEEKGHKYKNWWNPIKVYCLVNTNDPLLLFKFLSFYHGYTDVKNNI